MGKLLIIALAALGMYALSAPAEDAGSEHTRVSARESLSPTPGSQLPAPTSYEVFPGEVFTPRTYPIDYADAPGYGGRIISGWARSPGPLFL